MKAGASSGIIEVPLFTELYGYGPFLGRRNRGINDPLYCRAGSFSHDGKRVIIISNDLITMSRSAARAVRDEIYKRTGIPPQAITVCGSHTHSGPTISKGIGWGELNPKFRESWIELAVNKGIEAVNDEEEVSVFFGKSPLKEQLGRNRVVENGPTDPDIRWVKFKRSDGSVKLLIHNHAMHGVVFGPTNLLVSADWIGAANSLILDREIAQNTIFLQGAEGNINTNPVCVSDPEEGRRHIKRISESYVDSLMAGLSAERDMSETDIAFASRDYLMPTKPVTPEGLRKTAEGLLANGGSKYMIDRLQEMALYMEAGNRVDVTAELQVLKIGRFFIYAIPGEPFVELGMELMEKTPGFAMVAAIANGNCRYFPTHETFTRCSDILKPPCGGYYGYYEIHQGCGRFMPEYDDRIASFLVTKLLNLVEEPLPHREAEHSSKD